MAGLLRRWFWIALLGGAGFAAWALWNARRSPTAPLELTHGRAAVDPGPAWVAPVDGACPDGYPIKANDNSGIFHVPGGRFYDRTRAERCYRTAEDAEADGYRRSKS